MIAVKNLQDFKSIAEELLAAFKLDCRLYQTYPLLKRWQEILAAVPESDRSNHPWIMLDLPDKANQSYYALTQHPTLYDSAYRIEWMPFDIDEQEESEVKEHLQMMFEAWLQVVSRAANTSSIPIGITSTGKPTLQSAIESDDWIEVDSGDRVGSAPTANSRADSTAPENDGIWRFQKPNSTHYRHFVRRDVFKQEIRKNRWENYEV